MIRSSPDVIKERIILIPEIVVSGAISWGPKRKRLEWLIFVLAHEIAHLETLLEIPQKECSFYQGSCLYKELSANRRLLDVLKRNKIRVKKETFLRYASKGLEADKDHSICSRKMVDGLCPHLS